MKKLITILGIFICFISSAQYVVPRGFPVKNFSYYNFATSANGGVLLIDSFLMMRKGIDTLAKPLYPTIKFFQVNGVDSSFWQWDMVKWKPFGSGGGGVAGVTSVAKGWGILQDGTITSTGTITLDSILLDARYIQSIPVDGTGTLYTVLDSTNTPPGSPATNDAYMLGGSPTGLWAGHPTDIATWNGSAWVFTDGIAGDYAYTTDDFRNYIFRSSSWQRISGIPVLVNGNKLNAALSIGTIDNKGLNFFSNGISNSRLQISAAGVFRFLPLSGSGAGLIGIDNTGVASRVTAGTGISITGSTISATGLSSRFGVSGEDVTAAQNRAFAVAGFNFSISGATNFTLSANNYNLIEGINRTTINSLDSTYILGANDLELASVNIHSRATTSNVWGYTTSKLLTANSTGILIAGDLYSLAATNKVALIDSTTGLISHGFVDQASQIRGITPVANGGTSLATLTANNVILGNGTSAVQFVAPGTSGNILMSNGTTWASAANSTYWSKGQYAALATAGSLILQPTTLTDTFAVGSGLTSLRGKQNLMGPVSVQTSLMIGGAATAGYILSTQGSSYQYNGRFDGTISINTFADPPSNIGLSIFTTNAPTAINITGTTGSAATIVNTINVQSPVTQTSALANIGANGLRIVMINNVDGSSTETSNFRRGVYASINTKSNSTTPIPTGVGFESDFGAINSRTQTFDALYGFKADGIGATSTAFLTAGGNYYGFYQDSMLNTTYSGASAFGFYQRRNVANTIKNDLGGPTAIGGTITNDAASAGYVGEEVNSTISTYANYTTTATYQNVTSITLTAGDWDISAFFTFGANGATITAAGNAIFVISTTTASASGATEGLNIAKIAQGALLGTSFQSSAIAPYRVSLSATTTYYLNTQATFTLGNPQYVGSLRVRRIR